MSNNFLLKKPVESYEFVISSDIADILTAVYFTDWNVTQLTEKRGKNWEKGNEEKERYYCQIVQMGNKAISCRDEARHEFPA